MSVTARLTEATSLLSRIQNEARAVGLALVAARAVGSMVKQHLYGLDGQRHKHGRHYYRQAGDSVTTGTGPNGAFVGITQIGFRQRLKGGTINARPGSALTIPEDDEAFGKRAGEFNDLHLAKFINPRTGDLQAALVRNVSTPLTIRRRKQKDGTIKTTVKPGDVRGGEVMYWLVKSVTQRPDPTVLPYQEAMNQRSVDAIANRLARLKQRASTGGAA